MQDEEKEMLEKLFNYALSYYSETETELKILENQPEKEFIQDVFVVLGQVLEKFEE